MDTLEKVTETVRLFNAPVSMRQIAEATECSLAITSRALAKLVSQGVLEMVGSGNTRYYQIRTAKKSKEETDLETRFVELSEALDEKIARHDRRIERIEKETEHLYTNMISIMGVFVAIFVMTLVEPHVSVMALVFECVSALSTVGSSLDLTPALSNAGKLIIIVLMFVGRVGAFTLVSGLIRQEKKKNYKYPSDNIIIN